MRGEGGAGRERLGHAEGSEPTPGAGGGMGSVSAVVSSHRFGTQGHLRTHGLPGVPARVATAVARAVGEALTNVARHAGASTVVVRISYEPGAVSVVVEDDGRGGPVEDGTGILGMRERAQAVGGSLKVDERPQGGLRVRARLPYGGAR